MKKIYIILLFVLCVSFLFSQTDGLGSGRNFGSYNPASVYQYSGTLSGTEQLKIRTYIWGQVRKPGLYIVPDNTDLLTLISSAGGPSENAKLSKIKIIRSTEEKEEIIIVDLKEYLDTGNTELIPILQPGDTVLVSGSTYYAFTKAVDWLSQIAVILSVYISVSNLN